MQQLRQTLIRFPRLRLLLRSAYYRMQGLPPISYAGISRDLVRACVDKEDPTILDIGCNDGWHTRWFLETFEHPQLYCFEPDPRAIARFKSRVGQRANVHLFEMALSDHCGEIDFHQSSGQSTSDEDNWTKATRPEGWDAAGSIRQAKEHLTAVPWVTFDQTIRVPTSTLDVWCREHNIGPIDFVWMDVQGAEMDVFGGATEALGRTRFIYTEYSNRELYEGQTDLRGLIKHLRGFDTVVRYSDDILFSNKKLVGSSTAALARKLQRGADASLLSLSETSPPTARK